MIVNASTLVAAQKTFSAIFMESMMSAPARWQRRAVEIPMTTRSQMLNWLGRVPAMREWLASKNFEQLRGFDFALKTKDWESTIEIDRNDFEDDTLGLYTPAIQMLGMRAKQFPDARLSAKRRAGVNATMGMCYDGQFFYDTDHSEGDSGAQSNKLTGTGVTLAAVRADLFAAYSAMEKFKDDKGEPFIEGGIDPATQVIATIPPALRQVFEDLNNPGPGSTVAKTTIPYEVDPRLGDANDWYIDFVGYPIKPFLKLNRKETQFVALDDPNASETVFMRKKFYYGVEGRGEIEFGYWQMSIMTTNT